MFPAFFAPMLWGAGIGLGTSLLTKRDPLTGALIGGATGGLLGGQGSLLGDSLFKTGSVASNAGAGAGAGTAGSGAFEASMGLDKAYNAGSLAGLPGSGVIESTGMALNPATGTYLNPEYYVGAQTPLATYTGGEGLLSNAMGNIGDKIPDVSKYATPQNLMGVGNILSDINATPRIASPGGGVKGGGAVNYQPLSNVTVQKRKRRG